MNCIHHQVHMNFRQVKNLLITQNNKLGSLLGAITATADNVMYWDMPFQVKKTEARRQCKNGPLHILKGLSHKK